MTKKTRYTIVLAVFLAGVSLVAAGNQGARLTAIRQARASDQQADPYKDRTVLLEGFVVQVDMATLYEMDVNPLGQAPHAVSVENLLKALKSEGGATVLVGAKAAAGAGSNKSRTTKSETTYYARKQIVGTPQGRHEVVDHTPYENGTALSMTPNILSDDTVVVSYDFDYSGPRGTEKAAEGPLDSISWSWQGTVTLSVGQPRIVGATQDDEAAVFFVLTAHLLD